jgi:hypothetical protein
MKKPSELRRPELLRIVTNIQSILYLDGPGRGTWNRNKKWSQDTLNCIAETLNQYKLVPDSKPNH